MAERSKARVNSRSLAGIGGFESHRGHESLSLVSVVCCQLDISATGRSLVKRSPTECVVSLCVM